MMNSVNFNNKTSSMIRKRNRNQINSETSSANISSKGQSLIRSNKKSEKILGPFYSSKTFDKYASMISSDFCYCKKRIGKSSSIESCTVCYRSYHSHCLQIVQDTNSITRECEEELGGDTGFNTHNNIIGNICYFCEHRIKEKCVMCNNKILNSEIKISCELCGNYIHYDCLKIPISLIFNRPLYYSQLMENEKNKFEVNLKKLESQLIPTNKNNKNIFFSFLNENLPKYLVPIFEGLFNVCKFCLITNDENKDDINFLDIKVYQGLAFKKINFFNLSPIHEIYSIATYIYQDKLIKNYQFQKKSKISKIIDYFNYGGNYENNTEGFYLVKWKNNENKFSFEFSNFLQSFPTYENNKEGFLNKLSKEKMFYNEYYASNEIIGDNYNGDVHINLFQEKISEIKNMILHSDFENTVGDPDKYVSNVGTRISNGSYLKIVEELENNSNNLYISNHLKPSEDLRENFLLPFITSFFKDTSSLLNNPKILICYDDKFVLKKWKKLLQNNNINYVNLNYKFRFQTLMYEMFYFNLQKVNKGFENQDSKLLMQSQTINVDDFFKFMENIMTDYNNTKFDVILVERKAYIFSYPNILSKMNFNFQLMDFSDKDSLFMLKDMIKSQCFKRNGSKVLVIKTLDLNKKDVEDSSVNFSIFLDLFYYSEDWLIDLKSDNSGNNLKILSKEKKYFPRNYGDMLNYLKKEYNWKYLNLGEQNTNNNLLSNNPYYVSLRDKNLMDVDLNSVKIILNFIPVKLSKLDFLQYISILKERKALVLDKKTENKSDLIKNLSMFCSFPALMVKYYLNQLDNNNLRLSEDNCVNKNKLSALVSLIKLILSNENNTSQIYEQHINIIYSEQNVESDARQISVIRAFKNSVYKEFNREKRSISFYSSSDEIDDILVNSEKNNVFIFFSSLMMGKTMGKFFRGIFNSFKNRNLIFYNLYLENTIEQNLICEFYESLEDIIGKDLTFMQILDKETKEIILKKNILNLHYSHNNGFSDLIKNNSIFVCKDENKIKPETFDGIFIIDKFLKIITKNSKFFQSVYEDATWDNILYEFFALTNDLDNNSYNYNNKMNDSLIGSFKTRTKRNFTVYDFNTNSEQNQSKNEISSPIIKTHYPIEEEYNNNYLPQKKQRLIEDDFNQISNGLRDPSYSYNNNITNENVEMAQVSLANDNNIINSDKNIIENSNINSFNNINVNRNSPSLNSAHDNIEIIIIQDDSPIQSKSKSDIFNYDNVDQLKERNVSDKINNDKKLIESIVINKKRKPSSSNEDHSDFDASIKNSLSLPKTKSHKKKKSTNHTHLSNSNSNIINSANNLNIGNNSNNNILSIDNFIIPNNSNNLLIPTFNNLKIASSTLSMLLPSTTSSLNSHTVNQKDNINSLLLFIEKEQSIFLGSDMYIEVNDRLIKLGLILPIRMFIANFILKFGVDPRNLEIYAADLLHKINLSCDTKLNLETLCFYLEYFLSVLNNSNNYTYPEFCLNFIIGVISPNEIKKNILIINRIKEIIAYSSKTDASIYGNNVSNTDLVKIQIKSIMLDIIKNFRTNLNINNISNPYVFSVLTNLSFNLLKCLSVYGLHEYKKVLLCSDIREDILEKDTDNVQFRDLLYQMFKQSKSSKQDDVNEFLILVLADLYKSLEMLFLDKFEIHK